jgi:hypothetical protein
MAATSTGIVVSDAIENRGMAQFAAKKLSANP